jgi:hypothetical protein
MSGVPEVDQLTGDIAPGTPLEQLAAASELAGQLRARGDELLDLFVEAARSAGSSWSEIGSSLGTSKQAAQERFAALSDPRPDETPFGLRGTAASVLGAAGEEARALGHHYIRPEHIVLGLLSQPEELAARALAELPVTAECTWARLKTRLGTSAPRPAGSLGVAPQTKRLLHLAGAIGRSLGCSCPRTEHILLAAISPKLHSPAASLLSECGASPTRVHAVIVRMIVEQSPELASKLQNRSLLSRVRMRSA